MTTRFDFDPERAAFMPLDFQNYGIHADGYWVLDHRARYVVSASADLSSSPPHPAATRAATKVIEVSLFGRAR